MSLRDRPGCSPSPVPNHSLTRTFSSQHGCYVHGKQISEFPSKLPSKSGVSNGTLSALTRKTSNAALQYSPKQHRVTPPTQETGSSQQSKFGSSRSYRVSFLNEGDSGSGTSPDEFLTNQSRIKPEYFREPTEDGFRPPSSWFMTAWTSDQSDIVAEIPISPVIVDAPQVEDAIDEDPDSPLSGPNRHSPDMTELRMYEEASFLPIEMPPPTFPQESMTPHRQFSPYVPREPAPPTFTLEVQRNLHPQHGSPMIALPANGPPPMPCLSAAPAIIFPQPEVYGQHNSPMQLQHPAAPTQWQQMPGPQPMPPPSRLHEHINPLEIQWMPHATPSHVPMSPAPQVMFGGHMGPDPGSSSHPNHMSPLMTFGPTGLVPPQHVPVHPSMGHAMNGPFHPPPFALPRGPPFGLHGGPPPFALPGGPPMHQPQFHQPPSPIQAVTSPAVQNKQRGPMGPQQQALNILATSLYDNPEIRTPDGRMLESAVYGRWQRLGVINVGSILNDRGEVDVHNVERMVGHEQGMLKELETIFLAVPWSIRDRLWQLHQEKKSFTRDA